MIGESVMDRKWKILVTEKVGEAGLDIFRNAPDVELDVEIGLAEEELIAKLPAYDGILTRSGTTMDERKIEAGKNLKVIGRAGVGVDNIDLPAASRQGIIVINAPSGNTLAATELTMAICLPSCAMCLRPAVRFTGANGTATVSRAASSVGGSFSLSA